MEIKIDFLIINTNTTIQLFDDTIQIGWLNIGDNDVVVNGVKFASIPVAMRYAYASYIFYPPYNTNEIDRSVYKVSWDNPLDSNNRLLVVRKSVVKNEKKAYK